MTDMHTARRVEGSSAYPRAYRASGGWLVALILCGLALAAGGVIGTWFSATASLRNPHSRFWLAGLCLAFGALGVYCILSTFRSKVVLFRDRIEVEELTRTAVLSREEIRGWRSLPTSPPAFVLVPRDEGRRPVKFLQVFDLDPEFAEWLYTVPCLDSEDHRASKVEIRRNAHLGATPGERTKTLAKGVRFARAMAVMASAAALWGFFYPVPYELTIVLLTALPWAAVETARRSGGLFRIDANPNDAHPNVVVPFLLPGSVLLLRSVRDYNLLLSPAVAWVSIGIGGLLCLSAYKADSTVRRKGVTLAALFAFSLAYGYGVAIEANVLLDRSPAAGYVASVEGKRIHRGQATTYELELGPWGPIARSNKLRVSLATFDPIRSGDVVCLALKRGALGANWYFMRAWQPGDRPASGLSCR
jgi:hypothetical protein